VEYNPYTTQPTAYSAGRYTKSIEEPPAQEVTIQTLHRRFAHAGITAIQQIPKATQGIQLIKPEPTELEAIAPYCEVCRLAKGKKIIKRVPIPTPTALYEVVALDLIKFQKVNQDAGYGKYILHFYCRFSGMNHIYVLPAKGEQVILSTIQQFSAYTTRKWNLPIRTIQSDGESGIGNTTKLWLANQGITLNPSPPYTQDQNGAAERSGGVIITAARAIHIDSQLPGYMWPEVTTAAGYLLNRTPRQKYQWRTPWEVLQDYYNTRNQIDHDPRPKIGHIRIFGCRAYPLIQNQPKLAKLEARTSIGYLVGWDSTNVFRVWIPSLQKVIRTRDVTFDETLKFDPNQVEQPLPQPAIEVINLISITDFDQYYDSVPIDQSIDLVQSQGPAIPLLQLQTLSLAPPVIRGVMQS